MSQRRIDIVGGGLAGLLAAIELTREGAQVAVFEASGDLGGRARTQEMDGFLFNRGPHALFSSGALKRELDRFGIPFTGGRSLSGARQAIAGGKLQLLPTTLGSIAKTSLFGVREKLSYTRVFKGVMEGATGSGSFSDWLDDQKVSPMVRSTIEATGRLASYANGSAEVSARALLDQIRVSSGGTIYVDGGWLSLVNGLIAAAQDLGVELHVKSPAANVTSNAGRPTVVLANGQIRNPDAVIMAVGPKEATALAPDVDSLAEEAREARPVRANTLDLGLRSMPPKAHDFALGIDVPFYLSVHSGSAKLAPEGGALVHIAQYLPIGEAPAKNMVEGLEGVADLVMPGWREVEVRRQTLRGMVVSNGLPRWDRPRASVEIPDAPGLFLAGDWIGDEGMIADASAASAIRAAQQARAWASR